MTEHRNENEVCPRVKLLIDCSEAAEDDRRAKEKDMKMISNARDIFKTLGK